MLPAIASRIGLILLLGSLDVACDTATAAAPTTDDRVAVSANGSSLTGTGGGGGASASWLHNFDAGTLAAVAVEQEFLASSHWTFGSISGSVTGGSDPVRYGLYGEAHEGAGDDGPRAFRYEIEALGITAIVHHQLSITAEDRRVDVESSHGNLPKIAVAYIVDPHLQLSATEQYSVSGNLGTRLSGVRIDGYGAAFNWFAGVAYGQAAPAIYGVIHAQGTGVAGTALLAAAPVLHEGYLGGTKPLPRWRGELTLVADYLDLSGVKRATFTLNYLFHVGKRGS